MNHPLIPNSQDYMVFKKYVSINSNDRDQIKYPSASMFEIELPQDYLNVLAVKLDSWTFPANYNTFSSLASNVGMSFKMLELYNPGEHDVTDTLLQQIFEGLYANIENNYVIVIEDGFYTPDQMAVELTNKMNEAINIYLLKYLKSIDSSYLNTFISNNGYTDFIVAYNAVGQKLWFGNRSSTFTLTNNNPSLYSKLINAVGRNCVRGNSLPEFTNWGLPSYLGFYRCDISSINPPGDILPRFYYGDYISGDSGYWLTPNPLLPDCKVSFIETPEKVNLMGNSYLYLDIKELNTIDECSPFNLSTFTLTTNETNSYVNSALAKIPITTTPLSQWFDNVSNPYKIFNPPAERIRKLNIKLRYHNGEIPAFGNFEYSILLEFTLYNSQISRKYNLYHPDV
jgi:hypothetical protein